MAIRENFDEVRQRYYKGEATLQDVYKTIDEMNKPAEEALRRLTKDKYKRPSFFQYLLSLFTTK
jgi:hypothetical protein